MGAAERLSRTSRYADDSLDRGSLVPDEELDLDQWCVELDGALACLSTRQVWMALAQGRIAPETPVWRDGLGHWAPILDVLELTQGDEEERVSVPERSEIRVRRPPPAPLSTEPAASPRESLSTRSLARGRALVDAVGRGVAASRGLIAHVVLLWASRAWAAARSPLARKLYAVLGGLSIAIGAAVAVFHAREAAVAKVPRAQRVAVDVADRARLVSARARMQTAEAERRFWRDRWQ
ncbi:MAG: hypothetical protein FJ095_13425 [Deltaproteobacteria bacterium]|nr:hypothetical protein [Deltaproteobacteria bacterium]